MWCTSRFLYSWPQTVNFCPNSPESPFLEFQTRKPPQMKNFSFEITKVYSRIPPPQMKNFRFEITKVYSGIPPKWKTSDLRWPKFTPEFPPKMKNFRFEMTKVYSGIPPPSEKLQIWDDQSLLQNTPPPLPVGLESGRSYTNLYPPWIPLVSFVACSS